MVLLDLTKIEKIQTQLIKYPSLLYSPIKQDKVTIVTNPVLVSTNQPPTLEDALIMFDESKTSYNVPYIRYNGISKGDPKKTEIKRDELYKLYRGTTDEEIPNYKIIIPPNSKTPKDETFYLTVWNGTGNPLKATAESYIVGSYNLRTNTLSIKTSVNSKTSTIEKIEKAFSIKITD